jgi:hypothetical protein
MSQSGKIGILITGCLTFCSPLQATGPESKPKEHSMNSNSVVLNSRTNGDLRNSSRLQYQPSFAGEELWREPVSKGSDPANAEHIALYGDRLIIFFSDGRVEQHDRRSGKCMWVHLGNKRLRPYVTDQGIEQVSSAGLLSVLTFDKTATPEIWLPFTGDNGFVVYTSISDKDVIECFQKPPQNASGPESEPQGPIYNYVWCHRDKKSLVMRHFGHGVLREVLLDEKKDRLCMVTDQDLVLLPRKTASEAEISVRSFAQILTASLDPDGNVIAVLRQKDKEGEKNPGHGLARLDEKGIPLWFWPIDFPNRIPQPPAALGGESVYLIVGDELLRIEQGTVAWRYELVGEWNNLRMTVLPDESVLVAAGYALLLIDKNGKLVKEIAVRDKITCRPIVDESGKIYVAGPAGVGCIK